jgi:hypothetical protein
LGEESEFVLLPFVGGIIRCSPMPLLGAFCDLLIFNSKYIK